MKYVFVLGIDSNGEEEEFRCVYGFATANSKTLMARSIFQE